MAKQKFVFKSKMAAAATIRNLAGHHQEAAKDAAIGAAHRKWPPKKAAAR